MPIDASIPLGIKPPDQMQSLSNMLGVAKGAQDLQNQSISLNERKSVSQVLADPSSYTDQDGNIDFTRALPQIMQVAPTTGVKYVQDLMTAQKQHTEAKQSLNNLTTDVRNQTGKVLYAMPSDASPEVFNGTIDALSKQYKGGEKYFDTLKQGYAQAAQMGKGPDFIANAAKTTIGQPEQQQMNTPTVATVDNNQQRYGVNIKPGVPSMPVGAEVPGTRTQMQLPPITPTVGPNNQPGYLGPQPSAGAQQPPMVQPQPKAPQPGAVPNGYDGGSPAAAAPEQLRIMQAERAKAAAAGDQATAASLDREMARITQQTHVQPAGFVPSGPVPGANESKGGTVQVMNQHWDTLNKSSENSQLLEGLLGNIKSLAPGAITGTESGRKAYLNGLLNAMHLGNQATGDMQKDTDLLEKNIAQLGLNTPAATDAMRTIVGAARPHGTMSTGAIEEAAAQLTGQIQANRAVRNALAAPKQIADQTGDPSVYQAVRQHIEEVADPRAWQFQSLSPEGRKSMLAKLTPDDRASLRTKIEALTKQGLLK